MLVGAVGQHPDLGDKRLEQLIAGIRVLMHRLPEHAGRHARDQRVGDGEDAGRARALVDGRQLAEELAVADVAQDHLAAGGSDADAHVAPSTKNRSVPPAS